MNDAKILAVIELYREFFKSKGLEEIDYPHHLLLDSPENGLRHCHGMIKKMEEYVEEGRRDKNFRWLGFMQGVLFAFRQYTLDDLMNHNRPDAEEKQNATEYFNNLLGELTKAAEAGIAEQIRDESFWKDDRDTAIGNLSFDSFMVRQSKALKDIGGTLKHAGTYNATWYPPKGSRLYGLSFFGQGLKRGLYYLLCLKDGREFILKLNAKSIRIVDHLSPYAYRQLMIDMLWRIFHEKSRMGKVIKRFSKTGGYK